VKAYNLTEWEKHLNCDNTLQLMYGNEEVKKDWKE
jgi:hypothetical protein